MCDEHVENDLKVWFNFLHGTVSIDRREIQTKQVPSPLSSRALCFYVVDSHSGCPCQGQVGGSMRVPKSGLETDQMWRHGTWQNAFSFFVGRWIFGWQELKLLKEMVLLSVARHWVKCCNAFIRSGAAGRATILTLLSTLSHFLVKTYLIVSPYQKGIIHCFCVSRMGEHRHKESRISWIWVESIHHWQLDTSLSSCQSPWRSPLSLFSVCSIVFVVSVSRKTKSCNAWTRSSRNKDYRGRAAKRLATAFCGFSRHSHLNTRMILWMSNTFSFLWMCVNL